MDIIKASGEHEKFDREKFCVSVKRAGAPASVVEKICGLVEREIEQDTTTAQIARVTARYLKKENLLFAAKYELKKAIMDLGPAGFFFEEYMAAVLREYGYKTQVGKIVPGHCLSHEIDIIAIKEHAGNSAAHNVIELKYHNRRGLKTDVRVVMYTYARLLDIAAAHEKLGQSKHRAWVMTNTKFTKSAITYAHCMGMELIAWRYPTQGNIAELIEKKSLYPVTVLPSANRYIREQFAGQKLMFVRDVLLHSERDLRQKFHITAAISKKLLKEAYNLV